MTKLRRDIAAMRQVRETQRGERRRHDVSGVAIVGYTNAGKSSLLNALTGAGVLVEDALFATLDPTTRRAETPDGRTFTLTDTVGFVRHLPHQLVEAFRSTLERRRGRTCRARRRRLGPAAGGPDQAIRQVLVESARKHGTMPRELRWSTSATPRATSPWPLPTCAGRRVRLRSPGRRHRAAAGPVAELLPRRTWTSAAPALHRGLARGRNARRG
jgi:hypothetical protein